MIKRMKSKKIIVFLIMLFAGLNIVASASGELTDNKNYYWYFSPVPGNKQPGFGVSVEELKKYDAYAVGDPDDKVLYLTFDIGYENGNVKKCLDTLNGNEVKGSFFILEHVIKANTDLIKEIAETGHLVCNHTLKHKNMCNIKDFSEYEKEITGLERLYEETTGYKMAKYFRPPEGNYTKQNLEYNQRLGYKTIFWSVAYADWDDKKQPEPNAAIKTILNRTHNGAIILFHPTSSTNASILDTLIKEWKEQGYRFATLDELDSPDSSTTVIHQAPANVPVSSAAKSEPLKSSAENKKENVAIGNILNDDVMAYINGNPIPSWTVDGKTVVTAEDLANYGFDVVWNAKDQTLKIVYNRVKKSIPVETAKNTKKPGSVYCKYFTSNIRTYIAEKEVQAFDINGRILVDIEDLSSVYGSAEWNGTKREIKITVK